jgi:hypothetical protein
MVKISQEDLNHDIAAWEEKLIEVEKRIDEALAEGRVIREAIRRLKKFKIIYGYRD